MKKKNYSKNISTTSHEFEKKFEAGESILEHLDLDNSIMRINVDIPVWAISALEQESKRRGVTRQSLIKMWLIDRLDTLRN